VASDHSTVPAGHCRPIQRAYIIHTCRCHNSDQKGYFCAESPSSVDERWSEEKRGQSGHFNSKDPELRHSDRRRVPHMSAERAELRTKARRTRSSWKGNHRTRVETISHACLLPRYWSNFAITWCSVCFDYDADMSGGGWRRIPGASVLSLRLDGASWSARLTPRYGISRSKFCRYRNSWKLT
jgi:hypothetical protein